MDQHAENSQRSSAMDEICDEEERDWVPENRSGRNMGGAVAALVVFGLTLLLASTVLNWLV
jgi:hypothetical protein